jgi:FkbM family methyltransferase
MAEGASLPLSRRARRFIDEGLERSWDEPSRFGGGGLLARRALRRAVRPLASRQQRAAEDLAHALEALAIEAAPAGVPPPLDAAAVLDVESAHGPLFVHRHDAVMTPEIQRTGRWEPAEERFILSELRPGATFLDVGANIGYFSVAGARAVTGAGRVVAVEPEPRNVALLRANVWRNGLRNVAVLPLAASDRTGFLRLELNEANRGDHQVHPLDGSAEGALVAAARLDDTLRGLEPDLVKIDTQGADHAVVAGLRGLLRPGTVVLCEFWLEGMSRRGLDPHAVLAGYAALGLRLELLGEAGPVPATAEEAVRTAAGWEGQWVNLVLRVP